MSNMGKRNRRSSRAVILAAVLVGSGSGSGVACASGSTVSWNSPTDLAKIKSLESELTDPAKASRLPDIVSSNAVLLDVHAPDAYKGKDRVIQAYKTRWEAMKDARSRVLEATTISTSDFACSASEVHYDFTAMDGAKASMEVRQLDVFRRIDGHWRLIQQHVSAPVDTKTTAMVTEPLPVRGPLTWDAASLSSQAVSPAAGRKGIVDWTDGALRVIGITAGLEFFAPGSQVLLYGEFFPGSIRGADEIRRYYGPIMGSYSSIDVNNPVFEADSDGLLGAQIDSQALLLHMNDGGKRSIYIRQSDCLRRFDGKWRSMMEMVSFPIDRSSHKAIMEPNGLHISK